MANQIADSPGPIVLARDNLVRRRTERPLLRVDFQALFDASPAPLVVLAAPDFAIMAANDAYLRASMTVRADILGRTPFDVFPADPAASGARELRASLERVLATRRTDALAMHRWDILRPEAAGGGFEERWWSTINTPVLDPSGQLSSILMRIEDVTMLVTRQGDSAVRDQIARDQQDVIERLREANTGLAREDATRRRVEANLRASEERFRTLATSLPQLVFRSLGTGDRSWPSPQWQVYAGQSDAESRGYGWLEAVHPDDRAATLEAWGRANATGDEYYCEHRIRRAADGAYRWHQTRAVPLRDDRGGITEWVGSSADVDDMRRLQDQLAMTERQLRTLVDGVPQLIWRSSNKGNWTWASPQWLDFTGQRQMEAQGRGWLAAVHPDDRAAVQAVWEAARPHGLLDVQFRVRRATDGGYVWHRTRSVPGRDEAGRVVEWLGTTTDIQDLKEAQEHQQVLLAELQHRTRNLLAVVQSISRQTLRRSGSLAEFAAEYESRLGALSRVQSLLARANSETIELRHLVEGELAAHGSEAERVQVGGPAVQLAATSVQALALALHELATNAVKHGALGQPTGRLEVVWRVEEEEGKRWVALEWRESGVTMPAAGRQARKGYGSELIERALPYQLKAKTRIEFGADGVRCSIVVPAPDVRPDASVG